MKLKISLHTKLTIKYLFHSLLQAVAIFTFAWFNNCIIEMLIIYVSFFVFRPKFEKQYHAKSTWLCTIYTIIIFYVVSLVTPNKSISVLAVVIFTFFINYVSFLVKDYIDLKYPPKTLKNITIEELQSLCNKFNISELGFNRLKLRYIDKKTMKEIAFIENIELKSVEMFFSRIRERLKM